MDKQPNDCLILILVDDNNSLMDFMVRNIKTRRPGWNLLSASSCSDARRITDHIIPTMMMIDMGLPDGSGLGLMCELKRKLNSVPMIIVSSSVTDKLRREVAELGGSGVIEKPIDVNQVIELVEETVARENHFFREMGFGLGDSKNLPAEASNPDLGTQNPELVRHIDFHRAQNRLTGLLAGIRAFGADVKADAGDTDSIGKLCEEYLDRLCVMVKEVSGILGQAERECKERGQIWPAS